MCQNYAKAELLKIKDYDTQINILLEECLRLRSQACKVTSTLSGDTGGGNGNGADKIPDAIARIIAVENKINNKIDVFLDLKARWLELIEWLPSAQKEVIHRRYFRFESFEKISADLGYCYRNICYIHGKALQELNEILKGEVKDEPD